MLREKKGWGEKSACSKYTVVHLVTAHLFIVDKYVLYLGRYINNEDLPQYLQVHIWSYMTCGK